MASESPHVVDVIHHWCPPVADVRRFFALAIYVLYRIAVFLEEAGNWMTEHNFRRYERASLIVSSNRIFSARAESSAMPSPWPP